MRKLVARLRATFGRPVMSRRDVYIAKTFTDFTIRHLP